MSSDSKWEVLVKDPMYFLTDPSIYGEQAIYLSVWKTKKGKGWEAGIFGGCKQPFYHPGRIFETEQEAKDAILQDAKEMFANIHNALDMKMHINVSFS